MLAKSRLAIFLVGIYRLFTDQHLRTAVWDKVKHATVRGVAVAAVYVAATYSAQRWFVQNFLMSGYGLFGKKSIKPPPEILETGLSWLQRIDTVECEFRIPKHASHSPTDDVIPRPHQNLIDFIGHL